MNYNTDNKISLKEYLFLAVCLIIYFLVGLYLLEGDTLPKGINLIITVIALVVAIPLVIYMLKNIEF